MRPRHSYVILCLDVLLYCCIAVSSFLEGTARFESGADPHRCSRCGVKGLSVAQRRCLDCVRQSYVVTVDDLARELGTSPEGTARTVSSLVRRGLVQRVHTEPGIRTRYKAIVW